VILACFTAALCDSMTDTASLSAAAKADSKKAIRSVRYITDFCLMAQYRSRTPQTIGYMDQYLRKFHDNLYIFSEFRATKKDHQSAKEASRKLAVEQHEACQGKLEEYFQLSTTRRNTIASEERQERQQVVQEVLSQGDFNFPKIHLLSHYNTLIRDFGSLPQYSTKVTETLHKPLKDAYWRSNHVNTTEQILYTITREHALRIRELNIEVWSCEFPVDREFLDAIKTQDSRKWMQDADQPERSPNHLSNAKYPRFGDKQGSECPEGTLMHKVAERLMVPELPPQFYEYLSVNAGLPVDVVSLAEVARFPTHYYTKQSVAMAQFQGEGVQTHNVWCIAGKAFRKMGKLRNDWVWVRRRGKSKAANGELDGRIVGKPGGLFSMWDHVNKVHEVVLVLLLSVRGSRKLGGDKGMVRMECRNTGKELRIMQIGDIEGMAYLIGLKRDRVWLVNNRIDLNTWNELYD